LLPPYSLIYWSRVASVSRDLILDAAEFPVSLKHLGG
jgi:hypothetical protein